jgi:hypothetical protein
MTGWKSLGRFTERDIRLSFLDSVWDVEADSSLTGSLVLLHLRGEWGNVDGLRQAIRKLCEVTPLVVTVSGANASTAFVVLLDELQQALPRVQVMTKSSAGESFREVVEDLLTATWPSEERFDDWSNYSILVVGKNTAAREEMLDDVRSVLRSVGGMGF